MHFLSILSLAATVAAVAAPSSHELHEKRYTAPKHWLKRDDLSGSQTLPMRIGLVQGNLDKVSISSIHSFPPSIEKGKRLTSLW